MTVDGKLDSIARTGVLISGPRDAARVDQLRADADAVMVGGRTLLGEDPRLTVKSAALREARRKRGLPENPAKVGIVSVADLCGDSRFLTSGPARAMIFTTAQTSLEQMARLQEWGVEVHVLGERRVDLAAALDCLGELGVRRVLVEGGGTLNIALLALGLVDEMFLYVAPLIFGGASAPTLADGAGLAPGDAIRLELQSVEQVDAGGILAHYVVAGREPGPSNN